MSRLTATAVYSRLTFRSVSRPSTVVPTGISIDLPLTLIVIDTNGRAPSYGCGRLDPPSPPCSLRGNSPDQGRGVPGRTRFSGILPPRRRGEYTPAVAHTASPIAFIASGFSSDETSPAGLPR